MFLVTGSRREPSERNLHGDTKMRVKYQVAVVSRSMYVSRVSWKLFSFSDALSSLREKMKRSDSNDVIA